MFSLKGNPATSTVFAKDSECKKVLKLGGRPQCLSYILTVQSHTVHIWLNYRFHESVSKAISHKLLE